MNAVAKQNKEGAVSQERNQDRDVMFLTPEVDIYESKDEYILEADMPGVSKDGIDLTLEEHVLTIVGHRHDEMPPKSAVVYRESRPNSFRRVFELDPEIDTGKINARMENGILLVRLPKAERVKPRKIIVGE